MFNQINSTSELSKILSHCPHDVNLAAAGVPVCVHPVVAGSTKNFDEKLERSAASRAAVSSGARCPGSTERRRSAYSVHDTLAVDEGGSDANDHRPRGAV